MENIIQLALLPLGFYALIKGAGFLVTGASSIAKKYNISDLMIGLTIVALGTSFPELLVNILAAAEGATDLAIGNVIGSNISNILLVLGICAIIYPLSISKGTIWKEIPLNLLAVAALFVLANDALIDGSPFSVISRIDGIILMFFFIIFLYYSFGIAKNRKVIDEETGDEGEKIIIEKVKVISRNKSILYIIIGLITLPLGGQIVISGSLVIVELFNISESFVGLTILALGTSLPELATSVVATYKRNVDIAIGNIVGSNLFNIFWVLGLSALITPLPLNPTLNIDLMVLAGATALLFLFIAIKNIEPDEQKRRWFWPFAIQKENHTLSRTEGIMFVAFYVIYIGYLVWRG